ncbi:signal peptide peptidase 2 isoform X2 [Cryptomeria japonica]|uniref:signal peptide peptidase 2 isoform X2 n=1 Tax=Cryptomeria japonica TaxID=3369 RepID=UPI0025AC3C40|nr:signal peptide peptidase 2 isoform X2 [Cryptomeria japonica]
MSVSILIPFRAPPHQFSSSWTIMHGRTLNLRGKSIHCCKLPKSLPLAFKQGVGYRRPRVGKPCHCKLDSVDKQDEQRFRNEVWQWSNTPNQQAAYVFLLFGMTLGSQLPDVSWSPACYFLCLGVWIIYVGSHRSLGSKPPKQLSFREGILAPLYLSVSLFGFYCILHFFPNLDLQTFLSIYFSFVGVFAVAGNMVDLIGVLFPTTNTQMFQVEVPKWLREDDATIVGISIVIANKQAGAPFALNNFIAACIATEVLRLFSLGSFLTATALLSGLLLYDVFWVFGSMHVFGDNVMVTVATSSAFDAPIKLIFPHLKGNSTFPYSLLGLGDVTVPGLLTALMLKFDRSNFSTRAYEAFEDSSTGLIQYPKKTYFTTCIASYIFGLLLTFVANGVSGAAQPALLYLVPSQLAGIFLISFLRSEVDLLVSYSEEMIDNAGNIEKDK